MGVDAAPVNPPVAGLRTALVPGMEKRNAGRVENRNRQLASKTLLIAALGLFAAWHFLPSVNSMRGPRPGWHFWPKLWCDLQDPLHLVNGVEDGIVLAAFLNFTLLITISPFLTKVLAKSRLAWWFATICSGMAEAGLWGLLLVSNPEFPLLAGVWCLLFAPLLNFLGLLLARGKTVQNPAPLLPAPSNPTS